MNSRDERNVQTYCASSGNLHPWREVAFQQAFEDVTSDATKIAQTAFLPHGRFPVIDQGEEFIAGYSNDALAAWRGDLPVIIFGDHTRAIKFVEFPFVLGADGCKVLAIKKEIRPRFAYYSLQSLGVEASGYSRHFKFLKRATIRFPCDAEQRRIEAQLGEADRLRRRRRYSLNLSDTFLPAAFLQTFGDPIRNGKAWDVELLEDVCKPKNGIKAGPFGSSLKKEFYSKSGIRIYGQEQVIGGDFSFGDYYISLDLFEEFRPYEVKPDDLLLSLVGTFGKVIVVPEGIERGIINPRLLKISPLSDRLDPVFLANFIQHPAVQISLERMSHGGTMGILNAGLLKQVRVIIPPLPMQQQFAKLVARHEHLRAVQRESLRQAEHLFQTLLHRAFAEQV